MIDIREMADALRPFFARVAQDAIARAQQPTNNNNSTTASTPGTLGASSGNNAGTPHTHLIDASIARTGDVNAWQTNHLTITDPHPQYATDLQITGTANRLAKFNATTGVGLQDSLLSESATGVHLTPPKFLSVGGFERLWRPGVAIGGNTYIGTYGTALTYNVQLVSGDWQSLGGGNGTAIVGAEGRFTLANTNTFTAAGQAVTWTDRLTMDASGRFGVNALATSTDQVYVASAMGAAGNAAIKILYPGGGGLANTEFAALAHRNSVWSALYAKQGAATNAAQFEGRLHVIGATRSEQGIEVNAGDVSLDNDYGIYFAGSNRQYAIYREPGAFTAPYPDLRIAFTTGIKIGAYWGHGGVRFYNGGDMVTRIFSVGEGDSNVRVVNTLQADGGNWSVANTGDAYFAGSVGIGVSTPDVSLATASSFSVNHGSVLRHYRNVAHYNSASASVTGQMVITMPKGWSSTMMKIVIEGYDYSGYGAWRCVVSGYNYSSTTWYNTDVEITGAAPFTAVSLAYDAAAGKCALLLGATTTVWAYAKVFVTSFYAGHSSIDNWGEGWSITITATPPAMTYVSSPTPYFISTAMRSLGPSGGYYFDDRGGGQQWMLYATGGVARLWGGQDRFTVDQAGNFVFKYDASNTATFAVSSGGNLTITPSGPLINIGASAAIGTTNYASQTTGWRATYAGAADFRYLFTDELHAKSFIADLEQALAGGQIISKSVAVLAAAFTAPAAGATATLIAKDLPSAANMAVFVSGDYVRIRQFSRSAGSLSIADCWGTVSTYVDLSGASEGQQQWTFTRSSGADAGTMTAGTVVAADAIILDYGTVGNGIHEVNAIDGAYGINSPYSQIATWATHPRTLAVRGRFGNLGGLTGNANEFGLFAGSGWTASPTSTDKFLKASSSGVEIYNARLSLYSGSSEVFRVDPAAPSLALGAALPSSYLVGDGIWMGLHSSAYKMRVGTVSGGALVNGWSWDGATLTVKGDGAGVTNINGGNIQTGSITGDRVSLTSYLSINTNTFGADGIQLQYNAGNPRAYIGDGANRYFKFDGADISFKAANVELTAAGALTVSGASSSITGSVIRTAASGARIELNDTRIFGTDGTTDQWYASATDGKLYAGGGTHVFDANGYKIEVTSSYSDPRSIRFISGADIVGQIQAWTNAGANSVRLRVPAKTSTSTFAINVDSAAGQTATVSIATSTGVGSASWNFYSSDSVSYFQSSAQIKINATAPTTWSGWYQSLLFDTSQAAIQLAPASGGAFIGLHSDQKIYFGVSSPGQYAAYIDGYNKVIRSYGALETNSSTRTFSGVTFNNALGAADTRALVLNGTTTSSMWWAGSGTAQFAIDSISGGGANIRTISGGVATTRATIQNNGTVAVWGPIRQTTNLAAYQHYPNVIADAQNTTTAGAWIIHTPISRTANEMFRIRVHGYYFDGATVIDFTVAGYAQAAATGNIDSAAGAVTYYAISDVGSDTFIKRVGIDAAGKVAISFGDTGSSMYFCRVAVDCYTTYQTPDYSTGWSIDRSTASNFGWGDIHDLSNTLYTRNWFRSFGNSGWYNQDYGGGIHMTDSTYVRIYNSKMLRSDGGIYVEAASAPTLLNSWTNFGSPYQTVRYWKDPYGYLFVEGVIGGGTYTPDTTLFTLPSGYRPASTHICVVPYYPTNGGSLSFCSIEIGSTGDVKIFGASGGYMLSIKLPPIRL